VAQRLSTPGVAVGVFAISLWFSDSLKGLGQAILDNSVEFS